MPGGRVRADFVAKVAASDGGIEIRNNRIGGDGFLNQRCVSVPAIESIFLARRPKILLQQNLPGTDIPATREGRFSRI